MTQQQELLQEREYAARVQQILLAVISRYKEYTQFHDENIRDILADAWEELRLKPTALSTQDLEQLAGEIDRVLARKSFSADQVARYERMMLNPFFGRVDFREDGEESERIVVGLYSLKDEKGNLLVHDWRAPVCSLYYDALPGRVSFESPSGVIEGEMTRKRQYHMEDGRLKYFVDTDVNIQDEMLLDILSQATSPHMRTVVSTIQKEQNAVIRQDEADVLSVVGAAGSGKTSVAMHRVAYLMYRRRNLLEASRISILTPGNAFSEYISTVLPDLGEENAPTVTLRAICEKLIGKHTEAPAKQVETLLNSENDDLRRKSVRFKSDAKFSQLLQSFATHFRNVGPAFQDITLGKFTLATRTEMKRLYHDQISILSPAQRLTRLKLILEKRLGDWERSLKAQYEERLKQSYRGRELDMAVRLSITKQLRPVRAKLRSMLEIDPLSLYAQALAFAPEELKTAAWENAQASLIWWEDAPGIAWLQLRLGFAEPDKKILHLVIDEAQDYPDIALRMLRLYHPVARVTLLGDPSQRTLTGMPPCLPETWGACFDRKDAPILYLKRCYRSTQEITRLCGALLPLGDKLTAFGREGDWPQITPYSFDELRESLDTWHGKGRKTLAVITRTIAEAVRLSHQIKGSVLLTGDDDDVLPDDGGVVVASYQQTKGLEFDGVAVVWPDAEVTDGELRRLYTACSRALHELRLLTTPDMIRRLGIVL
ncbi:MAG: AAA family ATPase [Clostridia bacterium]|nr:AAA family ATPase [Clostridia bacterium]